MGVVRASFLVDEGRRIAHPRYGVAPEDTAPNARGALSGWLLAGAA